MSEKSPLAEVAELKSWQDKYRFLIHLSVHCPSADGIRIDDNLLPACESPTWLCWENDSEGRFVFYADSDSRIIKGLLALILSEINAKTAQQIADISLSSLLQEAGLKRHLSSSRNNGLQAVMMRVRSLTSH